MNQTIETHMSRKFIVEDSAYGQTHITVENTHQGGQIVSSIYNDTAVELGEAIIKAAKKKAFVFEGRLPSASRVGNKIQASLFAVPDNRTPESLLEEIKALITIREVLILEAKEKQQREAEEAKEALKLKERRDTLTREFCGQSEGGYRYLSETAKKAVDRVIELEDKLSGSEPLAQWEIDLLEGK